MIVRLAFTVALLTASLAGLSAQPASAARIGSNPMRFTLVAAGADCPGCVMVDARGEFTDDTSRDFAAFVEGLRRDGIVPARSRDGGPRVVIGFDSPGGKVVTALVVGRRIREMGWTTLVGQADLHDGQIRFEPSGCYSACSMVMLGGADRVVLPRSKAGIHQFSPLFGEKETLTAAQMNDVVRDYGRQVVTVFDYVQEMGAPAAFFAETLRTPFASMDVLRPSEWTVLGIATRLLPEGKPVAIADVLNEPADVPVAAASPPRDHATEARPAMGEKAPARVAASLTAPLAP